MSNITCAKCGAEIAAGSRFCRRCGQPAPVATRDRSISSSVLEAETRTFKAPPTDYATPTQHINSPPTGPAYIAPGQPPTPPVAATKPLEPSGSKVKWALLIGLLLILLIVPVTFAVVKILRSRTSQPQPPVITAPEIPPPPQPPPPPGRGGSSAPNNPLVYPGAETVMDMSEKDEGRVLQLRTRDPLDKVVGWYVEKIKPTNHVKVPGENVTVLNGEGINVVITDKGAQTEIIITQGGD